MTGLILHHYAASPFSEKIRLVFGYKQLAWKSVQIPMIMPKPDLVALTGGYRRTPVLQIGADVYCNTKLIVRVLDRLRPPPLVIPNGREASCAIYEQWSERFFLLCSMIPFLPPGRAHLFGPGAPPPDAFIQDRIAMFTMGKGPRGSWPMTEAELPGMLAMLDSQLRTAPFLDGTAPTLADFSIYHPIWFILSNPGVANYLDPYPHLLAWAKRMAEYGHGKSEEISSEEAIAIAKGSKPAGGHAIHPKTRLKPGPYKIAASDYGGDPVRGRLVHADRFEIALQRSDPRAGIVVVHFPRAGFVRVRTPPPAADAAEQAKRAKPAKPKPSIAP